MVTRPGLGFLRVLAPFQGVGRRLGRCARNFSSVRKFLSTRIHHAAFSGSAAVPSLSIAMIIATVCTSPVSCASLPKDATSTDRSALTAAVALAAVTGSAEGEEAATFAAPNPADFHAFRPAVGRKLDTPVGSGDIHRQLQLLFLEGRVS